MDRDDLQLSEFGKEQITARMAHRLIGGKLLSRFNAPVGLHVDPNVPLPEVLKRFNRLSIGSRSMEIVPASKKRSRSVLSTLRA